MGGDATSLWVSGSRTRPGAGRRSPEAGPEGTPRAPPRAPPRGELRPLLPASRAGRRSGSGGRGRPGVPHRGPLAGAVPDRCDGLGHPWHLTGAEPERAGTGPTPAGCKARGDPGSRGLAPSLPSDHPDLTGRLDPFDLNLPQGCSSRAVHEECMPGSLWHSPGLGALLSPGLC